MLFFAIDSCELKACQNWRINNKCVKDEMSIPDSLRYVANIHSNDTCQVRKQIDEYRLTEMLEK
jgi:hypothetical protein